MGGVELFGMLHHYLCKIGNRVMIVSNIAKLPEG